MKRDWRKALYQHYATPPEQLFPRFKLGASLFLVGLVIIYGGNQLLNPSLQQEITTLIGIILIGIGFLTAMMVQIRMVIGRIVKFFMEKPDV